MTVDAVLSADAMLPVPLARLTIATTAEPDFSIGTLRSHPVNLVDVGETIDWTLHVRNGGDGPARRANVSIARPESLIYVPNSTTVNDVPVRDSERWPRLPSPAASRSTTSTPASRPSSGGATSCITACPPARGSSSPPRFATTASVKTRSSRTS